MKLHDNVRKALSFAVFAGGQELWSHGFRWADALVKGVFFFLLWWVGPRSGTGGGRAAPKRRRTAVRISSATSASSGSPAAVRAAGSKRDSDRRLRVLPG